VSHSRQRITLTVLLVIQMAAAAAARWPLTTSDIRTQFEYQLAQVVITSENWHREGAWARHFIPTRSTDHRLSEWPYYDQDYITVPPLPFMAHYAATLLYPRKDPVVLAKIVAQLEIFVGVLAAALLLETTLGLWPTVAAFSFLIWTLPFLVWYINGYFPTTPALLVQLVFLGWVLRRVREWADGRPVAGVAAAAGLAALGACCESIALAMNAVVVALFLVMAEFSRRKGRANAKSCLALAVSTAAGTVAALTAIIVLYATRTEVTATFADRFRDRSGLKWGRVSTLGHANVIIRQMKTAWPTPLLQALAAAAVVLLVWSIAAWWVARRGARRDAAVGLAALTLAFVPSTIYHYVLQSHVTIHWWFTGTWTVLWVVTIALGLAVLRRALFAAWSSRLMLRVGPPIAAVAVAGAAVNGAWPLTDLPGWVRGLSQRTFPISMYHELGDRLPHDGRTLVASEMGELFRDYPFPSAYLRRPIVVMVWGALALPWEDEPADLDRLAMEPYVYVAYDPRERRCLADPVALGSWPYDQVAVCRAQTRDLLQQRVALTPPRHRP
jgi:hypothetical protein